MQNMTWEPESASVTIVGQATPLLRTRSEPQHADDQLAGDAGRRRRGGGRRGRLARRLVVRARGRARQDRLRRRAGGARVDGGGAEARRARRARVLDAGVPRAGRCTAPRSSSRRSRSTRRRRVGDPALDRRAQRGCAARSRRGRCACACTSRRASYASDERTLIADVRGSAVPNERFVFSAHVQEPGANDNASGVGAQAEMARVLASLVRDRRGGPEAHRSRSSGATRSPRRAPTSPTTRARTRGVKWGMSLDMVGEDTANTGGTFLIEKMPDPSAVWTRGDEQAHRVGRQPARRGPASCRTTSTTSCCARCLDQAATTDWVVRTNPFEGGSDHTPFLEREEAGRCCSGTSPTSSTTPTATASTRSRRAN